MKKLLSVILITAIIFTVICLLKSKIGDDGALPEESTLATVSDTEALTVPHTETTEEITTEPTATVTAKTTTTAPVATTLPPETATTARLHTATAPSAIDDTTARTPSTKITTTVPVTLPPVTTVPTTIKIDPYYDDSASAELTEKVNRERAKRLLPSLEISDELTDAAKIRALEISKKFSHTRPDGSSCDTVMGYDIGENIAFGQVSYSDVMSAWMNSSGHRENILDDRYTKMGAYCYVDSDGTKYWVQLFSF